MTQSEWWNTIDDFNDLISWCRDNEMFEEEVENIIGDDSYDEYVNEDISNYYYGWRDLRDALDGLPYGYDWYRVDGMFDYVGLDDSDFEDIKQDICDRLEDRGYFVEDDDEVDRQNAAPESEEELFLEFDDPDWEIDELDNSVLSSMLEDIQTEEPQNEYVHETDTAPIEPVDEYGDEAFDEVIEKILTGVFVPAVAVA